MRNLILFTLVLLLASCGGEQVKFSTASFSLSIDDQGQLVHLADNRTDWEYLATGQGAPFISIRSGGVAYPPNSLEIIRNELVFRYDTAGVTVTLKAGETSSHLRFEVVKAEPVDNVEMVIWGPYPTILNKIIGETVGVVQGEDYAIGLQALNPKTLGGYPWSDNDCMPQIDIFEGEDYSNLSEEGKRYVLYRVEAAKPEDFGSTLQAYCRNRFEDRMIENWGHEKYLAPAFDDGGVIGSKIALFGCPAGEVLDHIEQIELTEDLPHPMLAGDWGKRSQKASSSYMIMGFGEEDIAKALEYTKKAGLHYLYHPGPFETWGHFELNSQFPSGWDGLKACVDKAWEQDVFLGVHTLSNFITPNDAYVTPEPDSRLAKVGSTALSGYIGQDDHEIAIEDASLFQPAKSIAMRTVQIGDELVQYREVSQDKPWTLLGCERGAFGTKAAAHEAGQEVSLLADHAYKVFLSDAGLTMEMAGTIARFFNETGIRQVSFDGLEGNRSTGMGNYGEILMTDTWYENLDGDIKTHYIADASRTSHFFWHIYTRMNWGEPWYAGFRESQAEYRFKNQAYFRRNLMPGMLGWFLLTEKTSAEDIEWMLSKAAGYNAGFGFVCSYKSLEGNGKTGEILELINRWETARMQRRFTPEVKELLKSTEMEYHLEDGRDGSLTLWSCPVGRMEYSLAERQPGETPWSTTDYSNLFGTQPLQFTLVMPDQVGISELEIAIDNVTAIRIEETIKPGQIIRYKGGAEVLVYSAEWILQRTITLDPGALQLTGGEHVIGVKAEATASTDQPIKIEFRTTGNPQNIPAS